MNSPLTAALLDPLDAAELSVPRKPKKRGPSPMRKSVERLEAAGYLVGKVELWIPNTAITKDLYGFIDLLAIRRNEVLAVQTTSSSNMADRVAKVTNHANLGRVREANIRIEVHGWDGDRCRVVDLS